MDTTFISTLEAVNDFQDSDNTLKKATLLELIDQIKSMPEEVENEHRIEASKILISIAYLFNHIRSNTDEQEPKKPVNSITKYISINTKGEFQFKDALFLEFPHHSPMNNPYSINDIVDNFLRSEEHNLYLTAANEFETINTDFFKDILQSTDTLANLFANIGVTNTDQLYKIILGKEKNADKLQAIIKLIDDLVINQVELSRSYLEFYRTEIQIKCFQQTQLYVETLKFVKMHTFFIQYSADATDNNEIFSAQMLLYPLDSWFEQKLNNQEGEKTEPRYTHIRPLTLLQALKRYQLVDNYDLLLMHAFHLKAQGYCNLRFENLWNNSDYQAVRALLLEEGQALYESLPEPQNKEEQVISDGKAAIETVIADHIEDDASKKQQEVTKAYDDFVNDIKDNPTSEPESALKKFANKCSSIFNAKNPALVKTLVVIAAITAASILVIGTAFLIGFLAGAWTGPGAFVSGLMSSSIATSWILGAVGVAGTATGAGVAYHCFFNKSKQNTVTVDNPVAEEDSLCKSSAGPEN